MRKIFPSLLSANPLRLETEIKQLSSLSAGFHLDVMDYHFAPNLALGSNVVNAVAKLVPEGLCVHLMVTDPYGVLALLNLPSGTTVSFHYESFATDSERSAYSKHLKNLGLRPSIALSPQTPVAVLFDCSGSPLAGRDDTRVDHVLVMSVNPGFSGQQFIPETIDKAQELAQYIQAHQLSVTIAGDGGINAENIDSLERAGMSEFAVASAIFENADPISCLARLACIQHI